MERQIIEFEDYKKLATAQERRDLILNLEFDDKVVTNEYYDENGSYCVSYTRTIDGWIITRDFDVLHSPKRAEGIIITKRNSVSQVFVPDNRE